LADLLTDYSGINKRRLSITHLRPGSIIAEVTILPALASSTAAPAAKQALRDLETRMVPEDVGNKACELALAGEDCRVTLTEIDVSDTLVVPERRKKKASQADDDDVRLPYKEAAIWAAGVVISLAIAFFAWRRYCSHASKAASAKEEHVAEASVSTGMPITVKGETVILDEQKSDDAQDSASTATPDESRNGELSSHESPKDEEVVNTADRDEPEMTV